jgi:hypothetical protein
MPLLKAAVARISARKRPQYACRRSVARCYRGQRTPEFQSRRKSPNRRLTACAILPATASARCRVRVTSRVIGPRRGANRLPAFSISSSKRACGNTVAHPVGAVFRWAKSRADRWRQNIPPRLPSASRATQRPWRLRPMKKTGIEALTTSGPGRRKGEVAKASNFGSRSDANGPSESSGAAPIARNSSPQVIAFMESASPIKLCRRRTADRRLS